jgi:hypothetical protein
MCELHNLCILFLDKYCNKKKIKQKFSCHLEILAFNFYNCVCIHGKEALLWPFFALLYFPFTFHMLIIYNLWICCRNLRELFKIDAADYMMSICGNDALRELSSPGKSGSVFFLSQDDRFMIKTLRRSEVKVCLFYVDLVHYHFLQLQM